MDLTDATDAKNEIETVVVVVVVVVFVLIVVAVLVGCQERCQPLERPPPGAAGASACGSAAWRGNLALRLGRLVDLFDDGPGEEPVACASMQLADDPLLVLEWTSVARASFDSCLAGC